MDKIKQKIYFGKTPFSDCIENLFMQGFHNGNAICVRGIICRLINDFMYTNPPRAANN